MDVNSMPETWDEAFNNHPIPTVRAFGKQLDASVSRDKEKLRVLVGGNYRALLSTAENIVALDTETRNAELQISDLSRKCKPPQFDVSNTASPRASSAAQFRLLSQCLLSASSTLKRGSLQLCSQLLVISRLLLKSLSDQELTSEVVEQCGNRLTSLRRKLLRKIDIQLRNPTLGLKLTVQAVCAYCLITSASSKDALDHFQQLRLEHLQERAVNDELASRTTIYEDFRYFVVSVQSLRALLGRSVTDALANIQRQPILKDSAVSELEVLGLSNIRSLVPQDILAFTPYIKRVNFSTSDTQQIIQKWSQKCGSLLVSHLEQILDKLTTVGDVLDLRKELMRIVLPTCFLTLICDDTLPSISDATNRRIYMLTTLEISKLALIGKTIISLHKDQNGEVTPISLWDPDSIRAQVGKNGLSCLHEVRTRQLGIEGPLEKQLKRISSWAKRVRRTQAQFEQLKSNRWQDVIEEVDEDEEDTARETITRLTRDDPARYLRNVEEALAKTITQFERHVHEAGTTTLRTISAQTTATKHLQKLTLLLRTIRESTGVLRPLLSSTSPTANSVNVASLTQFDAIVPELHQALANDLVNRIAAQFESTHGSAPRLTGPNLPPSIPSPLTFSFLRATCASMSEMGGSDIWSKPAAAAVRRTLSAHIFEPTLLTLASTLPAASAAASASTTTKTTSSSSERLGDKAEEGQEEISPSKQDDDDDDDEEEEEEEGQEEEEAKEKQTSRAEYYAQSPFDKFYLYAALDYDPSASGMKNEVKSASQSQSQSQSKDQDQDRSDEQRIKIEAEAYWTRTKLLFGVLNP